MRYFVESLDEPLAGGVDEEPAPAEPLGLELELDDAPPLLVLSFFWSMELDELELDGELGDVVAPDEDAEPDGEALGEVELEEPDAEPEGDVEEPVEPAGPRSLLRLQPVTSAAPSAREIARASVETFMEPPWLNDSDAVSKDRAANVTQLSPRPIPWCSLAVGDARCRVRATRPRAVALHLEVALLVAVVRVDLLRHLVRVVAAFLRVPGAVVRRRSDRRGRACAGWRR